MTANATPSLDDLLRECLLGQFPNFEITPGDLPDFEPGLVGQIGFLTKEGRGSLGVVAEPQTLNSLEPDIGGRILDVADWIGELANQTLGRIKIRMRGPMDGTVSTTPIVLRETCLRICRSDDVRTFRLERDGARVGVWIDLTSIDLDRDAASLTSSDQQINEGETVLFF